MADIDGLPQLNRRLAAISDNADLMRAVGLLAVAESKKLVPRKTGNLARTIRAENADARGVDIAAGGRGGVGYAAMVEFGTRAHTIVPRSARVLAWPAGGSARLSGRPRRGGAMVFARRVHHPGTRPQPFMLPGAKRAISEARLALHIIRKWNGAA